MPDHATPPVGAVATENGAAESGAAGVVVGWQPSAQHAAGQAAALPVVERGEAAAREPGLEPLLSVVIPAFNEERTMAEVIDRVRRCGLSCEIIVVDDGSTDRTGAVLDALANSTDLRVVHQRRNQGKGAALKVGFQLARGRVVLVQDADLEYDPAEIDQLVQPIVSGQADVVFGSRFPNGRPKTDGLVHFLGNRLLTLLSNVATNLRLSDMETGYKVFRGDLIRRVAPTLREARFGIEPEITAKLARMRGVRICERPIHYAARGYAQGKKIGWRDGVWTVWCIVRYGLLGMA
ncbi:MAG TPA: glycosyltransferase family 2 protein [Pirellulales bacterium]|nr:glycosyltransferase family 2 protein [Pirellulales bacterium]